MAQIDFQAQERRLYLTGSCRDGDAGTVRQALAALQRLAGHLIVDLTAVTDRSHHMTELLVDAQMAAGEAAEAWCLIESKTATLDRALLMVATKRTTLDTSSDA